MALRRLFTGWLIAMAALARSVAQALERASEDRPSPAIGPAPDPVMAALAERYPGAPAHWLAHVAERTSQLAAAGETPLSLNSDPAAWPAPRPDSSASPAAAVAEASVSAVRRPEPTSRRDGEVPTLAALRDRPSEVWRRSDLEPRRRPRPVFAAAKAAPAHPTRPAATSDAPRRPRSPLTFASPAPQAVPSEPAPVASDIPAAETALRQPTWSEAPPSRLSAPEPAKPWLEAQATEGPSSDPALARTRLEPFTLKPVDRPETDSDRTAATPVARRARPWFFARPASTRSGRALDLSAAPQRRTEEGGESGEAAIAIDPATPAHPAFSYSTPHRQVASPQRGWRALTPPAARRAIARALAAVRAKPRPSAGEAHFQEPAIARSAPTDRPPPEPGPARPAPSFARSPTTRPAGAAPHAPSLAPPIEPDARSPFAEHRAPGRAVDRTIRPSSTWSTPADETQLQGRRAAFTTARSAAPRQAPRRFTDAPSDDRWPALPPATLPAPLGVEAPSPRWDQLAREQEEGRWSV